MWYLRNSFTGKSCEWLFLTLHVLVDIEILDAIRSRIFISSTRISVLSNNLLLLLLSVLIKGVNPSKGGQ